MNTWTCQFCDELFPFSDTLDKSRHLVECPKVLEKIRDLDDDKVREMAEWAYRETQAYVQKNG